MMFGGALCPADWSCIGSAGCNLATDIVNALKWNPKELKSLHQHQLKDIPNCPKDRPV
jgi:hypothetical protein